MNGPGTWDEGSGKPGDSLIIKDDTGFSISNHIRDHNPGLSAYKGLYAPDSGKAETDGERNLCPACRLSRGGMVSRV